MVDDSELRAVVERARRYDLDALAQLYDEYFDRIYRYILVRVRSRETAEDVAGEVFIRMLERIQGFEWRGAGFGAWLFRIAHNQVMDSFRRRSRPEPRVDVGHCSDPEDLVIADERLKEALRAVNELREPQREVVLLRLVGGLSARETAETLGITETNVRTIQCRAIARLREALKVKASV